MADSVDPLESAARQKDSEFKIVIRLFFDCSLNGSLPPGSILRMNALEAFCPRRHALLWIEAKYPIPFLGQMHGVPSRYSPGPTPGMREPLRLRQITLASPQRFFCPLALGDVRHGTHIFEGARGSLQRASQNVEVLDRTVRHQQTMLKIKICSCLGRAVDSLLHEISVVGMNSSECRLQRGFNRSIVLKDLVGFLQPVDLSARTVPAEPASTVHSLA